MGMSNTDFISALQPEQRLHTDCIASNMSLKTELYIANQHEIDIFAFIITNDDELRELDPIENNINKVEFFSIWAAQPVYIGTFGMEKPPKTYMIGIMSAYNHYPTDLHNITSVELGINIWNRLYWSKGFGKDALFQLEKYLKRVYPTLESFSMKTPLNNTRAVRCYEKCGYLNLGIIEKYGNSFFFMKKNIT